MNRTAHGGTITVVIDLEVVSTAGSLFKQNHRWWKKEDQVVARWRPRTDINNVGFCERKGGRQEEGNKFSRSGDFDWGWNESIVYGLIKPISLLIDSWKLYLRWSQTLQWNTIFLIYECFGFHKRVRGRANVPPSILKNN